jgi:hypothetical protein
MDRRLDVRRILLARGWQEDPELWPLLRTGDLTWGSPNEHRDLSLHAARDGWQVEFLGNVPAPVIVAACEAAGYPRPPRRSGATEPEDAAS